MILVQNFHQLMVAWMNMLILGEGPTQEIDDTALKAEAKYPINFKVQSKRF